MSSSALLAAASGMRAQQVNIETISNNIANINTTAFKKNRVEFKDLIYQEVVTDPIDTAIPGVVESSQAKVQVGNGVKVSSTQKIFRQGDIQQTGHTMDLAISGDGFFQLRRVDGSYAYTRDGSFKLSGEGSIVSSTGHILEPGFSVNSDVQSIEITRSGVVTATEIGGGKVEIGTIELAKFLNPGGLLAMGDNLYEESDEAGQPILGTPGEEGFGELHQGFLESSNVDIVEEMVAMITAQRSYEINSKTVKTVEEMLAMANNLKS